MKTVYIAAFQDDVTKSKWYWFDAVNPLNMDIQRAVTLPKEVWLKAPGVVDGWTKICEIQQNEDGSYDESTLKEVTDE